jgi:hypothetical protein
MVCIFPFVDGLEAFFKGNVSNDGQMASQVSPAFGGMIRDPYSVSVLGLYPDPIVPIKPVFWFKKLYLS